MAIEQIHPGEGRTVLVFAPHADDGSIFAGGATMSLEASDDGVQFRKVDEIRASAGRAGSVEAPATATFPAVRAK